jgi:hypothetical protein
MRTLLFLIMIAMSCISNAQSNPQAGPLSAFGNITIPSLMSLQVEANNGLVNFENLSDFKSGKMYQGFLNLKVVSTQPWLISFRTLNASFTPLTPGASADMPVSVMRIKRTGTANWISLSNITQPLLSSGNNQISNSFQYDALFELGWKYRSGNYTTTILFTLTPQ